MSKHAYLIMAYNQEKLLIELVKALDDFQNDIFIHIDKKSRLNAEEIEKQINKSNCYFTKQVAVGWGGQSLIEATLLLLKKSTETGKYDYYHLISGQDFPLRSQKEIHKFFDEHQGQEFISCKKMNSKYEERIRYYYLFQDMFGGRTIWNKIVKKISIGIQKKLKVNRMKNKYLCYGIGSQWFSITDHMARYVLSKEAEIKQNFYKGFCADEIFLQTLWLNAPFYNEKLHYHSKVTQDPYIDEIYHDVKRAIDWVRGTPYTYCENDYEMLKHSGCLFARKMSEDKSMKLIKRLKEDF